MRDFIESLRAKPEHVRRRVAVGASAGVTGVVAAGWIAALIAGGTLSLEPATPTDISNADFSTFAQETRSTFSNLIGGAAGAGGASGASSITVIDGETSSTLDREEASDATVIPF